MIDFQNLILKNKYFFALSFFFIGVLIYVTFSKSLNNDFVYDADDGYFLVDNPAIKNFSWDGVNHFFFHEDRELHYYPLSMLSLALDYHFFGMDPFYFRLHNIILHLLCSFLVLLLIWKLTNNRFVSLLTAVIFAIHPIQVESFIWVYNRRHPLFLMFFLAAILVYVKHKEKALKGISSITLYIACVFLYVCAIISKPTAITLPAILLLIDYYFEKDLNFGIVDFLKRNIPNKLPFIPLIILFVFLNIEAASRNFMVRDFDYSAMDHVLMTGHQFMFYIQKTFLPLALGNFYPSPVKVNGFFPIQYYIFPVITLILIVFSISRFRKNRIIFFGFWYYLVTLSPMFNRILLFSDHPMMAADRYYYQSAIGIFFLLSMAVNYAGKKIFSSIKWQQAFFAICFFSIIPPLSILSHNQSLVWKNTITLYEHLVKYHPSEEFYLRLAREYDSPDTVLVYKLYAVIEQELYDKYGDSSDEYTPERIHYLVGKEYNSTIPHSVKENLDKAKKLGMNTYFSNPSLISLWTAYLYHLNGDFDESFKYVNRALERNGRIPLAQFLLYKNHMTLNDTAEAKTALEKLVELELDTAGVLNFNQDIPARLRFLHYEMVPELRKWDEKIPNVSSVILKLEGG